MNNEVKVAEKNVETKGEELLNAYLDQDKEAHYMGYSVYQQTKQDSGCC